jgi:hypothetical protein
MRERTATKKIFTPKNFHPQQKFSPKKKITGGAPFPQRYNT